MKRSHKIVLGIAVTIGLMAMNPNRTFSQDGYYKTTRDLETWTTLSLKVKPFKKFSFGLDQGFRFNYNSTILDQALTDFYVGFKPVKFLELGGGVRYIADRGNNGLFDNDLRFNVDAALNHSIKRLDFNHRIRYQNKNEMGLSSDDGDVFKNYFRYKSELKYNIKNWKFDPEISAEVFHDLTRGTGGLDLMRLTAGTSYETKKFGKFGLAYRMDRELFVGYPKTTNIFCFNYTYTINPKKDKQ